MALVPGMDDTGKVLDKGETKVDVDTESHVENGANNKAPKGKGNFGRHGL
mgnify:FL=1